GRRVSPALAAARGPALALGPDCRALFPGPLRAAAGALVDGIEAVVTPADDGGYALIGMREADPRLFGDMPWSTEGVMAQTRRRLARLAFSWREPARLWDVDVPEDLERLKREGLAGLIE